MKKIISIIVPHYNSPISLIKLLKSIGHHDDLEVIVVDDMSTDFLYEYNVCQEKFERQDVVFLKNTTEQKGAGKCRNIGLSNAHGQWLLFADADDYMLTGWYDVVKKYVNCNSDIVYFVPQGDKKTERYKTFSDLIDDVNSNMPWAESRLKYHFSPPWSKMIRKSLVDLNQIFFGETRYSNDVLFSVKTGYHAKTITISNESIYYLCEQENSLTKQISFESISIRNEVNCEAYAFLKDKISRREMNNIYLVNVPLSNIIGVLKKGYGLGSAKKLVCQYRNVSLPLLNLSFDNIYRMLRKRFNIKRG